MHLQENSLVFLSLTRETKSLNEEFHSIHNIHISIINGHTYSFRMVLFSKQISSKKVFIVSGHDTVQLHRKKVSADLLTAAFYVAPSPPPLYNDKRLYLIHHCRGLLVDSCLLRFAIFLPLSQSLMILVGIYHN